MFLFLIAPPITPDPLAGRFKSELEVFLLLSLVPSIDRFEFARDIFCIPALCAFDARPALVLIGFLFSFDSAASFFVTLLISPSAPRFCPATLFAVLIVDFLAPNAFLTGTVAGSSLTVSDAAFALVRRVFPLFSSFSLLVARCRIERA